jgi:Tfp pilus assembly protein PilN
VTIKVDLLPTERKRFEFDPMLALMLVIIAICVVLFWLWGIHLERQIASRQAEITVVDQKNEEYKSKVPVIEDLKKKNDQLRSQIFTIKNLRYDPIRYSNLLDEISMVVPKNSWLNSLSIEPQSGNTVVMSGLAVEWEGMKPIEAIASLMENLQEGHSRYFKDASLASTSMSKIADFYTAYSFQIESHYDAEKAGQIVAKPVTQPVQAPVPAPAPGGSQPSAAPVQPGPPAASPGAPPAGQKEEGVKR